MEQRMQRMMHMMEMQINFVQTMQYSMQAQPLPEHSAMAGSVAATSGLMLPAAAVASVPAPATPNGASKVLSEAVPVLEPEKALPDEIRKHLQEVARDFERRFVKYLNIDRLRSSLRVKADMYKESGDKGSFKYPTGTRAWHAPVDVEAMDGMWSSTEAQDYKLEIRIPKGTSRRETMQRIHYACSGYLAGVHHEVMECHAKEMRTTVSKEEFLKACNAFIPKVPEARDDLDALLRKAINSEGARIQAETLYAKALDKARLQRAEKDDAIQKFKEAEAKKLEEAARLPPHKSLVSLIDARIETKAENNFMDEDDEAANRRDTGSAADKCAADLVSALGRPSGNGQAPKAGSESAPKKPAAQQKGGPKGDQKGGPKGNQKGQKKGQPKDQPKGNGKGKGQGKGKGKNQDQYQKGKGKGKGQNGQYGKGKNQQNKGAGKTKSKTNQKWWGQGGGGGSRQPA